MSLVVVVKGTSPYRATMEALGILFEHVKISPKKICLKPNLLTALPRPLVVTSPETCSAVVDFFRAREYKEFILAEGTTHKGSLKDSIENNGYEEISVSQKIDFNEMTADCWIPLFSPGFPEAAEIGIPSFFFKDYFLINIPKFKTHDVLGFTLGLKNVMGSICEVRNEDRVVIDKGSITKGYMHGYGPKRPDKLTEIQNTGPSKVALAVNIIRLARKVFSARQSLTILDGIEAMEGDGPTKGTKKKLGIIIASLDPVAVDAVATYIAGQRITYVEQAGKRDIGRANLDELEILGIKDLSSLVSPFKMHHLFNKSRFTKQELELLDELTRE
ncbi:MAG: DUF362 domain-containing protein [Candidatus Helarchaeota archaeon]